MPLYAHKQIKAEEEKIQELFINLPIKGKRTSTQTIKQVREIVFDMSYRIAQRCNIIVSYPRMSIQGTEVVLGEPSIILPDCQIVNFEQLREIELNYKKGGTGNGKR